MVVKSERTVEIVVPEIQQGQARFLVAGTSPLILNRMSRKAEIDLLLGGTKKNAAQKQATLKHNPLEEFRASPYVMREEAPTLLGILTTAFKGAMMTAALDLPSMKKAQIGRLVYVVGDYVAVYGRPYLSMMVTRSADINHTPDIRTRAIIPRWVAEVDVRFVEPLLNVTAITNLMSAAGVTSGVGDFRPEKGKGNYGQFELVKPSDRREFDEVRAVGRVQQIEAMAAAEPYDAESADLLSYWRDEIARRGFNERGERIGPSEPEDADDLVGAAAENDVEE